MSDETTAIATTTRKGPGAIKTHDIMSLMLQEMGPLQFCQYLAESGLYVKGNNAMAQIVAIIATGAEVGMPPMWSLKNIVFVGDKHSFLAGGVGDLVMRSGYMMYHVTEKTPSRCELRWTRNGEDVGTSYWDLAKARAANLLGKNVWKSYPESMLFARALTDGGRTYCPEVFGGAPYTAEELRTEVVSVTQNDRQSNRMPGVDHPDILQRPDGRAQSDYGKARTEAKNVLTKAVQECSPPEPRRVWLACVAKSGYDHDRDMNADDYTLSAAGVRAFHAAGTLEAFCDLQLGPVEVIEDAEVIADTEAEDPVEKDWTDGNKFMHAIMGKFLTANGLEKQGREYTIIKDVVRSNCDLPTGCEWKLVTSKAMRQMAKELEINGGKLAMIGLDPKKGDWTVLAASRGAI